MPPSADMMTWLALAVNQVRFATEVAGAPGNVSRNVIVACLSLQSGLTSARMNEELFETSPPEPAEAEKRTLLSRLPRPPADFRLTPVSWLVLLLMGVVWPAFSFYFLDEQMMLFQFDNLLMEVYYPTITIQLLTLLMILIAVKIERAGFRDLGLSGWNRWTIPQAIGFLIGANGILFLLQMIVLGAAPDSMPGFAEMLPSTGTEKMVWLLLSLTVAFSEEIVFRGYLLTRIARLSRGQLWLAAIISSAAFASGHLYQGLGGFVLVFIYGLMFVGFFVYTKSLYPAIIAHFIQDALVVIAPDLAR
ncbi:MAG: CPBP family intramembrane glutamic endopeptidase [bacterium]